MAGEDDICIGAVEVLLPDPLVDTWVWRAEKCLGAFVEVAETRKPPHRQAAVSKLCVCGVRIRFIRASRGCRLPKLADTSLQQFWNYLEKPRAHLLHVRICFRLAQLS